MRLSHISRRSKAAVRGPRPTKRPRPSVPALEWARDMTGLCPRVTAVGSHSVLVENHTGILAFSPSCVRLGSRAGALCLWGEGLTLCGVRSGALLVRGIVRRVDLPCEGGDPPDEG